METPHAGTGELARQRNDAQRALALVPEAPPLQPTIDEAPAYAGLRVEVADAARSLPCGRPGPT